MFEMFSSVILLYLWPFVGCGVFSSPCQRQCELFAITWHPLTFHIWIFSSETGWPNEPKLGRKHLWKILYKDCSYLSDPRTNIFMNARWKINILIFFSEDVDEAASDDENGQSYDKYYRMIKQEMDHLDNDVIPGDWTIVKKNTMLKFRNVNTMFVHLLAYRPKDVRGNKFMM